ncbi:hypothetical protein LHGZ1_2548 [Laribacter hongkongensis]|uniref:Uncharacterized protein n=1 Tax=Laribacter hongkongensis TaxID=168471 RepID=A0A248LLJ7_9NEIS|nr:hypothetical protein LHGZ1_2548 [Laribacter hongkongensis]
MNLGLARRRMAGYASSMGLFLKWAILLVASAYIRDFPASTHRAKYGKIPHLSMW